MVKRIISFLLLFVMTAAAIPAFAEGVELELIINGERQNEYELKSVYVATANNQMLAPADKIAQKLGAVCVTSANGATITKGGTVLAFAADSETADVNGSAEKLETAAQLIGGTVFVPVEFAGDKLGYRVLKERAGNRVRIISRTSTTAPALKQKSGMAPLVSEYHRAVPNAFAKSNELTVDNLIFNKTDYSDAVDWPDKSELGPYPEGGEIIFSQQDFINEMENTGRGGADWTTTKVDIRNEINRISMKVKMNGSSIGEADNSAMDLPFTTALQFDVKRAREHFNDMYVDFGKRLPATEKDDKYIVTFYARLIDGGDEDYHTGSIGTWIQNPTTYVKSFEEDVTFGTEWTRFDFLATGVDNAVHLRFMPAINKQVIQIGGYQVRDVGKDADVSYFTEIHENMLAPELRPDAEWRKEALKRIEQVRKGDFKVVVKDKNGAPVSGASVTFNMFEHEFKFGVMMDLEYLSDEILDGYDVANNGNEWSKFNVRIEPNFNALSVGNRLKWDFYAEDKEKNPGKTSTARLVIDNAKSHGIKYVRGHALWMPDNKWSGYPAELYALLTSSDTLDNRYAEFKRLFTERVQTMNSEFPEIYEWDVTNETHGRTLFTDRFGMKIFNDVYKIAADELTNGAELMLCDNRQFEDQYWTRLDWFKDQQIDYDSIGLQGHSAMGSRDESGDYRPTKWLEVWDRLAYEYQKTFAITEFSARTFNSEYGYAGQGDYMRDMLIAAFSHPACTGFNMWWMSDNWSDWNTPYNPANPDNNHNGAGVAPLYDYWFNAKPGLAQYQDLLYNKWWTRDAKTTTNSSGEGTVNGYFGDYDITVNVGGESKTVMAAFHKGYDNVLEITID